MLEFHVGLRCFKTVIFFGRINISSISLLEIVNRFLIDHWGFLMGGQLSLLLEMPIVTMFVKFILFINGKVHHELLISPDWPMGIIETMPFVSTNEGLFFIQFLLFVDHFFFLVLLLCGIFVQCHMQI